MRLSVTQLNEREAEWLIAIGEYFLIISLFPADTFNAITCSISRQKAAVTIGFLNTFLQCFGKLAGQ